MGRNLDQSGNDCLEIRRNIRRAQKIWGRLEKILRREGADTQVSAIFYRAVVQAVLLFGAES